MTQQSNLSSAFLRLVTASNNLKSAIGSTSSLTTADKTSLVAALNEVKASISPAASIIDDLSSGTAKTWSSSKINTQITVAVASVLGGADTANDTLKELADRITAVAQADAGLLSFAGAQTLTTPQKLQACTNLGIGDPNFDFTIAINANLAAGL